MRPKPPRRPVHRRRRPRPLLALRRRPRTWWALAATLSLLVGMAVAGAMARADAAREAWGERVLVAVARRDLVPGEEIRAGDLELVERPAAMVPADALHEPVVGRGVHTAVFEGEIVVAGRLAPAGVRGLATVLPAGTRAVAIPVQPGSTPPLERGHRVDVLVALPAEVAGEGPPGFAVATGALVVDVTDEAITVAVSPDEAAKIAVALGHGAVTLALVAP